MSERALVIDCRSESLVGILHEPDGPGRDLAVLVIVGGPQYRAGSHRQFVLLARQLAAAGYGVLRFDYRGMGDSTGSPRTFDDVGEDIRVAVDATLRELPSARGVVAFGLCDAASAALMYVRTDSRIAGMVLANPWVRTETGAAQAQVKHYYGGRILSGAFWRKVFSGQFNAWDSVRGLGSVLHRSLGRSGRPGSTNVAGYIDRMLDGLAESHVPVLLLMSEHDLTAREFDDLCRSSRAWSDQLTSYRVRRLDVEGADHTFSSAASRETTTAAIIDWLQDLAGNARK